MARSLFGACAAVVALAAVAACGAYGTDDGGGGSDPAPVSTPARAPSPTGATPAPTSTSSPTPGPAATGCDPTAPFASVTPVSDATTSGARYATGKSQIVFTRGMSTPAPAIGTSFTDASTTPFAAITNHDGISYPSLSPDAKVLYFGLWSKDSKGNWYSDIYTSTRASTTAPFAKPAELIAAQDTGYDFEPYVVSTGKTLYWRHQDTSDGTDHVKQLSITSDGDVAEAMVAPATSGTENPVVSADELTMYYGHMTSSSFDVFVATRTSTTQPFSNGAQIPSIGDPSDHEFPTWISDDQCEMLFESWDSQYANVTTYQAKRAP